MPLVVVVIFLLALPLWFLLRLGRRPAAEPLPEPPVIEDLAPMSAAHDLYVLGEGERLLEVLDASPLGEYVTLSTALGRYAQALAAVEENAPRLLDPAYAPAEWHEWLLRINVAETLCELGRTDAALALVSTRRPTPSSRRAGA